MADDKTLIAEARAALSRLCRGEGRMRIPGSLKDDDLLIEQVFIAFEALQGTLLARPVQRQRCLDRDGEYRCKLLEGHGGAHEMARGPPEVDRLAAAEVRVAELETALQAAEPFTQPEITRGPASDAWMDMRRLVEKALSAPPDSGKLGQRPVERGDFGPTVAKCGVCGADACSGHATEPAKCEHEWGSDEVCRHCGADKPPQTEAAPSSYELLLLTERDDLRAQLAAANARIQELEGLPPDEWAETHAALVKSLKAANERAEKLAAQVRSMGGSPCA